VIDLSAIAHDVIAADSPNEISGVTLIGGEPAELVDAHWLFGRFAGPAALDGSAQPVCRLPSDDPWMQNMLRPIIEAAGYRVVSDQEEVEADLAIVSAGASASTAAARVIQLRADPEAASPGDDTIYRYDRAALLMALKSAGGRG
jgi:two-component system chemotaxis sensor kinase CheA